MAKSAKKKAGTARKTQADPVDAFLGLIAEKGWFGTSLGQVAQASGLSLAELYKLYPSKVALLNAFSARVDASMLEAVGPAPLPEEDADTEAARAAAKDRLFEALMARLDALGPHKDAIRRLARDLPRDPPAALCFAGQGINRALDWALAASGLEAPGLAHLARRKAVGLVFLDTLRIWLDDEGPDLARTMAHLDKRLGLALAIVNGGLFGSGSLLSRLRRKSAAA